MMKISRYLGLLFLLIAASALPMSAATGHFDRTLKVSGTVDLEVTSGSGNINVHTGGNGSVIVSAKIHARDSWFGGISAEEKIKRIESNPPIEQSGNSIHIGRIEDRDLRQNISIDYDVTVPAQTSVSSQTGSGDQMISGVQLPLTAKTGSGNIKIDNIGAGAHIRSGSGDLRINTVKGALNAEAGSGNIEAEGIAGEVYANTGSGDVELHQVAAGDVQVQTGSGTVRIRGVKGGLRVQTGSGDIHAEGEPTHDWRVGAGSGNIDLRIPSGASFDLSAQTSSGTLNVNRQITMQGNFSRNHIEGKVGNGGVRLDLHTGSGNIQLD